MMKYKIKFIMTLPDFISPNNDADGFICPHCNAHAHKCKYFLTMSRVKIQNGDRSTLPFTTRCLYS